MSLFDHGERPGERVAVAEGATWLKGWLPLDQQAALIAQCRGLMEGPAGGYVPLVRGGRRMHVRMLCLGRHWNARTYAYESVRSDHDARPVAALPPDWIALASRAAADGGFTVIPDVCIVNFYDFDGRMGLHQDKDESAGSIAEGAPVVSISLGDTARFLLGGVRRRDPVTPFLLESGDAFVFGGPSRLRYHGVTRILSGSAPAALAIDGRFNLTFRRY